MTTNHFGRWMNIQGLSLDDTVNLVHNEHTAETSHELKGIQEFIGDLSTELHLLDFGSGVGRNAFPLAMLSSKWTIDCFDNKYMLEKAIEYSQKKFGRSIDSFKNINYITEWENIKTKHYDVVVAILVFQHIKEEELKSYIMDIKKITNKLVVSGRRCLDGFDVGASRSVWDVLEEAGLKPYYCSQPDKYSDPIGNPRDHFTCIYKI